MTLQNPTSRQETDNRVFFGKCNALVLIDDRVADIQGLKDGLSSQFSVYTISGDQDGLIAISRYLAESPRVVSSLHIISHATPGVLKFGAFDIDETTLAAYAKTLAGWQVLLADDAEILLYGCNLAEGEIGKAFVNRLAELTGLTVAASETLTGHADLGGDWQLQYQTGIMSSPTIISAKAQAAWFGVLDESLFGEEQVNAFIAGDQQDPRVKKLADGSYVVVWQSNGQDGDSWGIYAQHFSSVGEPIGPEFRVNTLTNGTQHGQDITALSDGGFLITWQDSINDGSGYGVYGQRYDEAGVAQGSQFLLNTTTANNQFTQSVAAYTGGFASVWSSTGNVGGNGHDIYLQRFDNAGNKQGSELLVSTIPGTSNAQAGNQTFTDVEAYANGNLVIIWTDQSGNDGSGYGVYGRLYNASTDTFGNTFLVNTTTSGNQSYNANDSSYNPHLAVLSNGDFVVVWPTDNNDGSGWAVVAQRFDADGNKLGGEFRINESTAGSQYQPDITALSTGGFVVTWHNDNYDVSGTGTTQDVYIREYDNSGVALGGQRKLISPSNSTESTPAIADLGNGNFVVAYSDYNTTANGGNNTYEVAQQIFANAGEIVRQASPELSDFSGTKTFGENLVNAGLQIIDPAVSLTDIDSANFDGGSVELFYTQFGSSEDQLGVVNQGNGFGQIGVSGNVVSFGGTAIGTIVGGVNGANLTINLNANATVDAVEALIQALGYGNSSSSPQTARSLGLRVSDGDGGVSAASSVTIEVTRELDGAPSVYGQEQVNTFTASHQDWPSVATLNDGSYVVVWESYTQDGTGNNYSVYAQRFANNGEPMGPEFLVNNLTPATTGGDIPWPHIAALSNGNYVITWGDDRGHDGSGWGIYGRIYNASGVAQGDQFIVNTTTSGTQYNPSIEAYNGGFAGVWSNGNDIYLQRFDNAGVKQGAETLVSTIPGSGNAQAGAQYLPDVAAYANGNLVFVWNDWGSNDGSSGGVYARLYNASTSTFGSSFLVNTTTAGNQSYPNGGYEPNVAVLSDGSFVVVWPSDGNDGNGWAVMGQRFDANGNKLGGEFQINETTAGSQYEADVTALSTGGFVVTFYNDNYDLSGTGSYQDVYIREYDAAGNAIDGQRKVNTPGASQTTDSTPAIADLGSGNFVVVWTGGGNQDGSGNGVYQQLFGDVSELARPSANPELGDFTTSVTFAENTVNATPQVIDAAVSLTDVDSANFAGGQINLFYIQGGGAEDQLSVRNQGNSVGQIGVSGSNVTYGGAGNVIGTIAGGVNGANLAITLTANASIDAVEALIQNLTYGNSSNAPQAERTLGIRVSDGDGGVSAASTVTIDVARELDGAPAVYGQEQVNTFTASNQEWPSAATLTDGSYVVTWTSYTQDGSGNNHSVYAQRFANNGEPLGPEFIVNNLIPATTGNQITWPQIAALSNGNYVITWQDDAGHDGSGWGVYGRIFNAAGVAQGDQFLLNTTTSGTQYHDNVAAYTGGFAGVWSNGDNIYLQRFDNAGVKQGVETLVSTIPGSGNAQAGAQYVPDVAADTSGNLVIVWSDAGGNDSSSYGVFGRLYNVGTGTFGSTFQVNTTTASYQSYGSDGNHVPNVAMLSGGGFVVVWNSYDQDANSTWGVYGQRFDVNGNKIGAEFQINETTVGSQYQPDVTALSTGGFVVNWYNDNYDLSGTGSYQDIYIREYDSAGNAIDGQRKVNTPGTSQTTDSTPAIADLGSGNFVVVWTGGDDQDGSGNGVYQQLFGTQSELARPSANPELGDFAGTVTFAENTVNTTPQVIDAAVSLTDVDSANFAGGQVNLFYVQGGAAEDQLGVRNQGTGAGQIGVSGSNVTYGGAGNVIGTIAGGVNGANLAITLTANATVDAVEALIQNLTYGNSSNAPQAERTLGIRVSDGDGGVSAASSITVDVTREPDGAPAVYGEEQVNTYTANAQEWPSVATLNDGSYVVTWVSYTQDGTGEGIYAQRFNNNGEPIGAEFRVNTLTSGNQDWPQIAALSNGGYVITWEDDGSNDGSGWGVYAQRYDASGAVQGGQFLLNTTTSGTQYHDNVAAYTGGFAGVWSNGSDILLQRFDNAGVKQGGETLVSTIPSSGNAQAGAQYVPDVAAYANGNLVVVWNDWGSNDGSGGGVYGRLYDAGTGNFGNSFLITTTTIGNQSYPNGDHAPNVTVLSNGQFVVVWSSDSNDGNGWAVIGQRFDANGSKLGGEFQVNETTAGSQYQADITALSTGGFVVTFYNDNYDVNGTGSYQDVYIREYDATGNAIDGQHKVNTPGANQTTDSTPAVADLGSGNYVVVWTGTNQESGTSGTNGVFQQLFGTQSELVRPSSNPILEDITTQRILSSTSGAALYAGNPQIIDTDVKISDTDSVNFDTGTLLVSLLNGGTASEALAIRNEGTNVGQIGVSGSNVSYGGTVIGTFTGGTGLSPLTVTLNAAATASAVQALVQNITYQNSAPPAGTTDRYIGFRLFDGDGGVSLSSAVDLRIQATVTPQTVALADIESAVTLGEAQAQAGVILDDAIELNYNGTTGFNNGTLTVTYVSSTGRPTDQLFIHNEGSGAGQIGVSGSNVSYGGTLIGTINAADNGVNGDQLIITFNASATDQAIERVIENLSYQTTSDGPNTSRTISIVVRDGANVASTAFNQQIDVTPTTDGASFLFGEQQVNTYETGEQHTPVVGRLFGVNNGDYVIVWRSNGQDGDSYGINAQRYDSNGVAVGPEFQVNTQTFDGQYEPAVTGLNNGGFVVSWRSDNQDGSGAGVYAQIFDSNGVAVGNEFRANTTTTGGQYQPAVVGLSDGSFVISYYSDYNNGSSTYDVLGQRYSAAGTPLGTEFVVNTVIDAYQSEPQLAALTGGGFVAAYTDTSAADGSGYGIKIQRFANDGSTQGIELIVNTTVAGNQQGADIAGTSDGGFVVVWHDNQTNQVLGQRFDASGTKVGAEFVATNADAPANQTDYARVAAMDNGGFVVAWDGLPSSQLGGSSQDVMIQQFDASGNKVDGPIRVNATTASTQYYPDIAGLSGSNFVVTWAGYNQESNTASTYGIFSQLFGNPASVARQVAPLLVDVDSSKTFAENLVNAVPQIIDPGVGLTDTDSANFDGGQLIVSVISGYGGIVNAQLPENVQAQDQLSIRNQGTGANQVGVSGANVTFGGTIIGSITSSGANGNDLVVTFNTNATSQIVEAVIENLTYANSSQAPIATRTLSILVSDGDGGTSIPRTVQINVTPEYDGAQPLGTQEQVNTYSTSNQDVPAIAKLSGGGYVIVWESTGQDGWGDSIHGQRYDAKGVAVGSEFQVNTYTPYEQQNPTVTGLSNGGFVVLWESSNQDGSSTGVYGQRFDANGIAAGNEFLVNTYTANEQSQVDVVGVPGGGFVATWYNYHDGTHYYEVYAQRFDANGAKLGGEIHVNTSTGYENASQYEPAIASFTDGSFIVVWRGDSAQDGSLSGVYGQRFAANGDKVGDEFLINTYTDSYQYVPDVAVLNNGGFVVTWTSYYQDGSGTTGVYAQRYDASGNKVGDEFRVNTTVSASEQRPTITALSNGGFTISWDTGSVVYAQQYDANGVRIDGETRVDDGNSSNASQAAVAGLANGAFVVAWQDYPDSTASTYGVFQRVFGNPADFQHSANPDLVDVAPSVTFAENAINFTPAIIDAGVGLFDADSANFDGGILEVNYLTDYGALDQLGLQGLDSQDQLGIQNQGTGAGQVGVSGNSVSYGSVTIGTIIANGANGEKLSVQFNANATPDAIEHVIEHLTYANNSSDPIASRTVSIRVSDGDGGASAARTVVINVTPEYDGAEPLGTQEQVNTYLPVTQGTPAVARLNDGGYVVVWQSDGQDGWDYSINGQRYDAKGVPVGSEFQVNSYTPYSQTTPTVTGLSNGGYVVLWESANQDGSSTGVYGQRFDANGVPAGNEFLVNSYTTNEQSQVDVAGVPGGGFVATWYSYHDGTNYYEVYAQRFDANGGKIGGEIHVNTSTGVEGHYQAEPAIATFADGSFIIAFRSDYQDPGVSDAGVYAQRFNADGSKNGNEFLVNTYTDGSQYEPDVTVLNNGGFVITWRSDSQDSSSAGVYAQRYNASGVPVGDEFRVNTTVSGSQYQPTISALSNGGFVISWTNGSTIYAQQYDVNGVRIDGETRVDDGNNNNGSLPAVAGLGNGAFVVAWQDYPDAAGNTYGVFQRVFGNPTDFQHSANPELVDVVSSVTFAENAINFTPAVIDSGVGLFDADSANFDGGVLEVNYLTDYGALDQLGLQGLDNQDQLGIRNQGTGAGQVGVSGSNVSYGGVTIGSIVANGANGEKLTVVFNANATPDAVEHVIENLTYANTTSDPIASRTVSIRVSDGDGGASVAQTVQINVTPQIDGAVPLGLEKTVNTTIAGNQHEPSIAHLKDGGYVVVWTDQGGADGNSYGVYGQRYDANDNEVGTQFKANTFTTGAQYEPQVVGLNGVDGGFVVVWRSDSQDGSGTGVYAQRYNADGSTAGGEFRVNTTTTSNQYEPTVAATADGGFVVAWFHDYYSASNTEYQDIFFQRYNASGVAQGVETKANPGLGSTFLYQSQPSITWLSGGGFVVTWTDNSLDGNSNSVYGQVFNATGGAVGNAFQVNSYVTGSQEVSAVAALKDGGFVVAWESEGQDLSSTGIYAQRFDATGAKLGGEFRVNTDISGTQYQPAITGLENGGWVITWTDTSSTSYDVYMQQYNAAGQRVDGETRVNTYTPSTQYESSISSMPDGGFVVSYAGYKYSSDQNGDGVPDGGNDTYEIRLQRFSNTAPTTDNINVFGAEDTSLVLSYAAFAAGFHDPDGQALQAVKITTLPAEGVIKLNGVAITIGQEIGLADLQANLLTYQGNANYFGTDQFRWTGSDGISFASTPVFGNITLTNVNDAPGLEAGNNDNANEGTFFSHAISLSDPDPDGHQITVNWGDGTANTVFTSNSANPSISHYFADQGNYSVTVTANDQQNQANSIETDSFVVNVANVAPTINLSGINTIEENQVYTLTLGSVIDPGADVVSEYRINWGDGSDVQIITAANLPANRQITHTYSAAGAVTINTTLVDEDGVWSNAGTKAVTVSAPAETITVDAGADRTVNEGTFISQTISFTDPTDAGPAGRLYTVNWGDGNSDTGRTLNTSFNLGHTYADGSNNYTATVTVDDDGAQSNSDSFNVTVNNVAPTINLGGAGSVNEGSVYTLNLNNVIDPGADNVSSYTVHWGDGTADETFTADQIQQAAGNVTHTYVDGLINRTITVDLVDEDGTWLNAGSRTISVLDVAPVVPVTGADSVNEGSVYTLNLGSVSDPGQDTPTLYTINWGDGSAADTYTPTAFAGLGGVATHTYADGGLGGSSRTIVVSVTDEEGTHQAGTKTLTVNNVAPEITLGGDGASNEGASYSLSIAATDPAGTNDTLGYSINWGDGSAVQTLTAAQLAGLNGNVAHVFTDDEDGAVNATDRTISVTVNDGDGGTTTQTKAVTVNNVAPTIALSGADAVIEDSVYTLTLGNVTDPGTDTVSSYVVNWGDGSTNTYSAAGNVTHTYADPSTQTINVNLVDEDGTFTNAGSKTVTVNAATATLSFEAGPDATVNEGDTFSRTINFSDGQDNGAMGWGYSVDYGDGTTGTGTVSEKNLVLNHQYTDGNANRTVSVTLTDDAGETASDSFQVAVNNVAPLAAVTGADTVNEGSVYSLSVGAVTDPGADTRIGYSIDWGDGNTDTLTPDQWGAAAGNFSHTYADGGNGGTTRTVIVSATDEDGTFTLGSKALTVNNVAPEVTLGGNASSNEGASYSLSIAATDPAGANDALGYSINWGDGSAVQNLTAAELADLNGSVSHVFADDQDGPVNATDRTVSVTVNDGDGGATTQTKVVTINNVAPLAAVTGADSVNEGSVYTLNVGALVDPGSDTLISGYIIDWGDGTVQGFTPASTFTHVYPDGGAGGTARTVTVSATDEDGTFVLGSKTLTVNNAVPTVQVDGDNSINEGGAYSLNIVGSDPAGVEDTLSYSINWGDGSAVQNLTALELAAISGKVIHVFADDQDGSVNATDRTISVTISDEDGGSSSQSKVVTVNNVAPTIALSGANSVVEDTSYTLALGAVTDPGQDSVSNYLINWNDGSAVQNLTAAELAAMGGDVTHTFANPGNYGITVDLVDEDGTFNSAGTKTLAVTAAGGGNNAPVADDEHYIIHAGQSILAPAPGVLEGDTDVDGDLLTVLSYDATGTHGTMNLANNGGLQFTPETGFVGTTSFIYTVSDGHGGTDEGLVTIDVTNAAPVADDEHYSLHAGQNLLIPAPGVLEGDTDADGDSLRVVSTDTTGTRGSVNVANDGGLQFTPEAGFVGTTSFKYMVSDGLGGTDEGLVTIDVTNASPVADDEHYSLHAGQNLLIPAPGVLEGDTDADGDSLRVVSTDTAGTHGTVNLASNGGLQFTPELGFVGTTSFKYTVGDGLGGTDEGLVTIDVTNTPPVADDDVYTVHAGQILIVDEANGLLNGDTDADGDSLIVLSTSGGLGQLNVTNNGAIAYIPAAGFVGQDTFTYIVSDGFGGDDTATVTFNVTNSAPVVIDEAYATNTGETLTVSALAGLLANDTDADGDVLQVLSVNLAANGNLAVQADGSFVYTPNTGFVGVETIAYTVTDGFLPVNGQFTINVTAASSTLALEAGADATVNEGDIFSRTINFSDGEDNGAAGWSYSIDYGDGSAVVFGTTLVKSLNLSHLYTDGNANPSVSVTLTDDVAGETVTDSFQVTVNNVAPSATIIGANTVNEGSVYTIVVGDVTDPGADIRNGYSIDWGDGVSVNFTATEWANAAGQFSHTYADGGIGGTARKISVSATDEDGTFKLGSKTLTVNNVAPIVTLPGATVVNEGANYVLAISGSDAGVNDVLGYSIDWGDGSTVQNLSAAELAALSGNVNHVFADDEDGSANATNRTISVIVSDADGGNSVATQGLTVNNVAPALAVTGADQVLEDTLYTLNLGVVNDPGDDTVSSYVVHWGDGTDSTYSATGDVTHSYANAGSYDIIVTLTDEDGSYDLSGKTLLVNPAVAPEIIHLGDAVGRPTLSNPNIWAPYWTDDAVSISHKADYANSGENWSAVQLNAVGTTTLAGGDLWGGDLGVSGRNAATSSIQQEIQGHEALRFDLTQSATKVDINLTQFFADDDANILNYNEAGRLQAFDSNDNLVKEVVFTADSPNGNKLVTLESNTGFDSVVLTVGAYDTDNNFVFGAYANDNGEFATAPYVQSSLHGSDFLVDNIEFELVPIIGVPAP